jgi:hypothetical protein
MIAKEMETIMAFDFKYAEGVEKRNTEGCCINHQSLDYIFKLKGNHGNRDREREASIHVHG